MSKQQLVEWLSALPAFAGVPVSQLEWFADGSEMRTIPVGTPLITSGLPVEHAYIIHSGRVQLISGQDRVAAILESGDVTGLLPYSRMKTAASSGIAATETEVVTFPATRFREMIQNHYELTEALVHHMLSRVRDFTSLQQQNEKMMALGKLSAGLAHELNNPAAAIARDAQALQRHLVMLPDAFRDLMHLRLDGAQVDALNEALFESLRMERPVLTLMQRTDREDELGDWLHANGVQDRGELAEAFTDFGFCQADFERVAGTLTPDSRKPVLKWIADNIITDKMVGNIGEAARRIESLIGSIKSFTHMDRGGEAQFADIHTGIRNTLTMLGHKLRQSNVTLEEAYDPSLPPVRAMIGELNQVWTNIIDNALDAMEGRPGSALRIETLRDGNFVRTTIADNGPGIPEAIRSRIFDPFFTTKDIGKGTGLGLDVVQRIVQQHRGSVKIESTTGRTAFIVCFPING
jgi:signal transduction histidine kinase